jgi:metallophosphoesterase superfamily enzyme
MTLVRGNHDNRAGDPPVALGIAVVDEPHLLGPFACCHHPQTHPTHFVLAGHLHPACSLQGRGRDRLRIPCFVQEGAQAILPAFGEFTGGWQVPAAPGRRFYGVGGDAVWALPETLTPGGIGR